jgi:hypothetical protein
MPLTLNNTENDEYRIIDYCIIEYYALLMGNVQCLPRNNMLKRFIDEELEKKGKVSRTAYAHNYLITYSKSRIRKTRI